MPMRTDRNFGFEIPLAVDGLPDRLLDPRANWPDAAAYDAAAAQLVTLFAENTRKLRRAPQTMAAE